MDSITDHNSIYGLDLDSQNEIVKFIFEFDFHEYDYRS